MFTSDNIKLSEVIFIWFLALSSTLYPALIEFIGFCFICSFCLSFLLPGLLILDTLVFYFLFLSQLILNLSIYQNISDSACIIISEQKVFRIVSAYCFLSL